MGTQSKEQAAAALLGELLVRLAKSDKLKMMLADMNGLPVDELARELIGEFEKIVDDRRLSNLIQKKLSEKVASEPPHPAPKPHRQHERPTVVEPPEGIRPPALPQPLSPPPPAARHHTPERTPEEKRFEKRDFPSPPPAESRPASGKLEFPAPPRSPAPREAEKPEVRGRGVEREDESREPAELPAQARELLPVKPEPSLLDEAADAADLLSAQETEFLESSPSVQRQQAPRTPYEFGDEDLLYLHAVCLIPQGETASPDGFMLEEKGIEDREFVFAFDYCNLRFYLSKILGRTLSVSKKGILLLGKQESIRLWGSHEGILNDLRAHGVLLPFEFGTVTSGKDAFLTQVDGHLEELKGALDGVMATSWWNLGLYVLDDRIAQLVGTEAKSTPGRREREQMRSTYSIPAQGRKYDIKVLERLLNREKKIAESVHDALKALSERTDIELTVNLGSGVTEDWKAILKASYEVPPERVHLFNRAVIDLQYQHFLFDITISVRGAIEEFSLHKKAR